MVLDLTIEESSRASSSPHFPSKKAADSLSKFERFKSDMRMLIVVWFWWRGIKIKSIKIKMK